MLNEIKLQDVNAKITDTEIAERFGSTWVNIYYTITDEFMNENDLLYKDRVLSIRIKQSETDLGQPIMDFGN